MNQRLQQFLNAENISQSQFADRLGVAKASVSHILAGRNKPGYDFIESLSRQFPNLNLEWLINGRGRMYKVTGQEPEIPVQEADNIFENTPESIESQIDRGIPAAGKHQVAVGKQAVLVGESHRNPIDPQAVIWSDGTDNVPEPDGDDQGQQDC